MELITDVVVVLAYLAVGLEHFRFCSSALNAVLKAGFAYWVFS